VLNHAWLEGPDHGGQDYAGYRAFLAAVGLRELTRTRRGWTRTMTNTPAARTTDSRDPVAIDLVRAVRTGDTSTLGRLLAEHPRSRIGEELLAAIPARPPIRASQVSMN
jgi:hypothetical protein